MPPSTAPRVVGGVESRLDIPVFSPSRSNAASRAQVVAPPRYLLAVLAIALSTALFLPGRDTFAKGQWALLYLLLVVLVAGASGAGPAVLAAVLAFFAWDFFFLPPYHTLTVHDPKDWLSLVAFLAVGVVMGVQTGRMRDREARALAREHETAALNRLSASLVSEASTGQMAETILGEIIDLLGAKSATLFVGDDEVLTTFCVTPPVDPPDSDSGTATVAHWVYAHDAPVGLPHATALDPTDAAPPSEGFKVPEGSGGVFLPLRSATGVVGVLSVAGRSNQRAYDAADARLLASLANLIATFLDRQRLQAAATSAEALREADRLKSSLLSSVSHELKTPLAALTATVSNLLEGDVPWNEKSVRDELRAIVADVARLNNSIGALLDLSRLEARAWEPHRELYELPDILAASLGALPVHQRAQVTIALPDDLPPLRVDFEQCVKGIPEPARECHAVRWRGTPAGRRPGDRGRSCAALGRRRGAGGTDRRARSGVREVLPRTTDRREGAVGHGPRLGHHA